jgi:hypothetical protein
MATWKARRTPPIVGEGRHEAVFVRQVQRLYAPRGCGLSVTVKYAHGKGAKGVIDWTTRQIANAAYDEVAVMLDTDQDWSPAVDALARSRGITVLKSIPCFEAVLLRLMGENVSGSSRVLKKRLAPFVDDDPTEARSYGKGFDDHRLQGGRRKDTAIDELLRLLGV